MLRAIPLLLALALAAQAEAQAEAQARPEGEALSFAEALEAVNEHPDVRGPLAAAGVVGRTRTGGPNGFASITLQAGYDTDDAGDRAFTGQLSPLYSFILMREARAARDVVDTRRRSLEAEAKAALLEHQLEVAEAWLVLYAAEALSARLEQEERLLTEWRTKLDRALRGGLVTSADLVHLEAEAAELAQRRRRQEMEIVEARRTLAQSLAMPHAGAADLRVEGDPPPVASCASVDATEVAARLPAAALARRRSEDAEAFARFDLATFWPAQLNVGAQVPLDSRGVTGIVGLQIPMISAQRAIRARDSAEAARLETAEDTARRDTEQLVASSVEAVRTTSASLRLMRERTLPSYEALHETVRRRLQVGEATIFEDLASRRRLLEARAQEAALSAANRWASIRLELLLEAAGGCTGRGDRNER